MRFMARLEQESRMPCMKSFTSSAEWKQYGVGTDAKEVGNDTV